MQRVRVWLASALRLLRAGGGGGGGGGGAHACARAARADAGVDGTRAGRLVGSDAQGNRYFTNEAADGDAVQTEDAGTRRRWVQYANDGANLDSIPDTWATWLRGQRDTPPTPQEMSAREAQLIALRQRALLVEQRERAAADKFRLKQELSGRARLAPPAAQTRLPASS